MRCLLGLAAVALVAGACSAGGSAESGSAESRAATAVPPPSSVADGSDSDDPTSTETANDPDPTAVPEPTLAEQDLATVVELQAGEQVQDAQGNLIAIYGIADWPTTFTALAAPSRTQFPFFSDVQPIVDPAFELVVLDIGMCAAGLDVTGFGTAEFFVHESPTEILSTDSVVNRGLLTGHPVVHPGFDFPSPATCARGYLPVVRSSDRAPTVARYVLATRATAGDPVEQHVYQWDLDTVDIAAYDGAEGAPDRPDTQFAVGQTVTFNTGGLRGLTVDVDGWAELIGAESAIAGTRMVAVALDFCPAAQRLPEFGLGVDGWNIVSPVDNVVLGADAVQDPTASCFDGWLEFAIPFGSVPTAFFASDGVNAQTGYAEWSLLDAAVPAPQS